MYRSDLLYCDLTCDQFATKKWDDSFMKLSEKMNSHKMFKGLKINKEKPCFDPGSRPLINFKELKSLLLGTDFDAFEKFKNKYAKFSKSKAGKKETPAVEDKKEDSAE